ncbi:Oligopeptide-binding protein SarA [Caprobacter fermentans]|uniref:Oligopeptide-binding protein SarA n=1 Tax=Caproicibacter fermentans TaxID=2576756 RepID=A0A6N8HZ41_9FIRM|nr:peptide ABC transporter substrate-binding protein [Caproicibacter fermentans]MVB10747.1 Oligopeptide-binding protein SarA [Caproicibacter fermentans]
MKSKRKGAAFLLACVMVISALAGCSGGADKAKDTSGDQVTQGPHGIEYAADQTLRTVYSSEATSLNPFADGSANDWEALSNCIDGLVEVDQYKNTVPSLAESWTVSDDGTVYTFKIRKGLQWVDTEGNQMGELTAKDFVTVANWICDPANASGSTLYFSGIVKGAKDFIAGKTKDFSTVGFKAVDDNTLQITLEGPLPYFLSYCGSYMPAYAPLFEKLGSKYGADNNSMYYIGAYRMTTFAPQSKRVYEKNDSYWDSKNVHIKKIISTYNAEATTLAPEMFLRGEVDKAPISTDILDQWMKDSKTKDIVIPSLPDTTYMFYYAFNYMPKFDQKYEPDNWNKAISNENFRQSLYWGLDRYKALLTKDPYNAQMLQSNSVTPKDWCSVDGKDYTEIGDMAAITSRANYSFDSKKALDYKEKAKKELEAEGVTFPIKMLMPYNPTTTYWAKEVQVVKQQLTGLLGSDYIEPILEAGPSTGFLSSVRRTGDYAFMKCNNGATIADPAAWLPAFAKENNWTFLDQATDPAVKSLADQYYAMVDDANSVYTKSTERYEKFAKAEAFLLNHALVIPYSTDNKDYMVERLNPFEAEDSTSVRFKYQRVLSKALTKDQWTELYRDWQTAKEKSIQK